MDLQTIATSVASVIGSLAILALFIAAGNLSRLVLDVIEVIISSLTSHFQLGTFCGGSYCLRCRSSERFLDWTRRKNALRQDLPPEVLPVKHVKQTDVIVSFIFIDRDCLYKNSLLNLFFLTQLISDLYFVVLTYCFPGSQTQLSLNNCIQNFSRPSCILPLVVGTRDDMTQAGPNFTRYVY